MLGVSTQTCTRLTGGGDVGVYIASTQALDCQEEEDQGGELLAGSSTVMSTRTGNGIGFSSLSVNTGEA